MEKSQKQLLLKKSEEPTKFILVGISGVFVNNLFVFIVSSLLGIMDDIAIIIGIIISMTTNYIFNRIWTFKSSKNILPEYFKFIASNSIGAILQYGVAKIIIILFNHDTFTIIEGILEIPFILIAVNIGIGAGFISNFFLSKYIVF